ncbi:unnamed protein product [Symbiodinium sp. CCMP2592]|nr:unnamed protein product [Symbiodinium sp. CCMP2592]
MLSKEQQMVIGKVIPWLIDFFGGSGDPEQTDAVEICTGLSDFLIANFGTDTQSLKNMFLAVQKRLHGMDVGWVFRVTGADDRVPLVEQDVTQQLVLMPWHLSFRPEHSQKGKSKMLNIIRCAADFLEKPYDSLTNPIQLWLPPGLPAAGEPLPDFALGHSIGFTKSLAIKAILFAVHKMKDLSDEDVKHILPQLQALYNFRCTCHTTGSSKFDRFRSLQDKFAEAARPRPDPIQVSTLLMAQAKEEGLAWTECASFMIDEFNGGSTNDAKKLSELETSIVVIYPSLDLDTQQLIDYHWQVVLSFQKSIINHVNHCRLCCLFCFLAPKSSMKSDLWVQILKADNRKRYWFVRRKVQYFLFKLQDAKRLKKKINLATGAANYRDPKEADAAWGMSALFAHFHSEFQRVLTSMQLQQLETKFARGYLDVELFEKFRVMNPQLKVENFRFLADVGAKVASGVPDSQISESDADLDVQKAELAKAMAKVAKEVAGWSSYQEKKSDFARSAKGLAAEAQDEQKALQKQAVEKWQENRYPVRDLQEASHAITFAETCVRKFQDEQSIPDCNMFKVFWMNPSVLGYDSYSGMQAAVATYAPLVAEDPAKTVMIIAEYVEANVGEATQKISECVSQPENRLLVREVLMCFDQNSIPAQSKRPGFHKFFIALSDQCDKEGRLISEFSKSALWKRQMLPVTVKNSVTPIPMLAQKDMVDPRRGFSQAGVVADLASKPSRRKQWIAGFNIPGAFHDALWQGLTLQQPSGVSWVDVFAYDHSVAEALMRRAASPAVPAPQGIYVGVVWADTNSRDDKHTEKGAAIDSRKENAKISRWLQSSIRRKLQYLAQEKVISIPDWKPLVSFKDMREVPAVQEKDFVATFPGAADTIPVKATYLEEMDKKLNNPDLRDQWDRFVKDHNECYNKSGKPHQGEKRSADEAAGGPPQKKARLLSSESLNPESLTVEQVKEKEGPVVEIDQKTYKIFFTSKGSIWIQTTSCEVELDDTSPLALTFGKFKINEEAEAALKDDKVEMMDVGFGSDVDMCGARKLSDNKPEISPLKTLRAHLQLMEEKKMDVTSIEFACHKLKPRVEKDSAGDAQDRVFDVKKCDPCVFIPQPTPRKITNKKAQPDWDDVGSIALTSPDTKAGWNLKDGSHVEGLVSLKQRWVLMDNDQGLTFNPEKPGIYLTGPVKIEAKKLVRVA